MWTIQVDSDGHRWLITPQGFWIASFSTEADVSPEIVRQILDRLNGLVVEGR